MQAGILRGDDERRAQHLLAVGVAAELAVRSARLAAAGA